MELLPDPEWLNKHFLVQVLQSVDEIKAKVELGSWSCAPAIPAGSNFLSQLYRVTVNYNLANEKSSHSISLIVKAPVASGPLNMFLETVKAYEREDKIYQEVLPAMYRVQSYQLAAQPFYCPVDKLLVLQDLNVKGYIMVNRLKQLDAVHCRQSLVALARFHALSVAVHHKHPDLIQDIGLDLSNADYKYGYMKVIKFNLNMMIHAAEKLDRCKQYIDIIHRQIDSLPDKLEKILKIEHGFMVLNHGDPWLTNILFKYNDNGEVIGAKFVDFQFCKYCSFAQDLIFFWFTSANEDVRENNKEELFELYRQTLNQTLEETDCIERLSKEELDSQIRDNGPFALSAICTLLVKVMADPDNKIDFSKFNEQDLDKPRSENICTLRDFQSKYYMSVLPAILRQMDAFGAYS